MMMLGVCGMGVFLSFLVMVNYGTDTSTFMNKALAARFGVSFGTMMVITNGIMFIPVLFVAALALFVFSVAVYMNADLGLAPFDAIPVIVGHHVKIPFFAVRMCWDFLVIVVGLAAGGKLTIGTVCLAVTIGPVCGAVGRWISAVFNAKKNK